MGVNTCFADRLDPKTPQTLTHGGVSNSQTGALGLSPTPCPTGQDICDPKQGTGITLDR